MEQEEQRNLQALGAFLAWIVEAMEFVPLSDEAKPALDILLHVQTELRKGQSQPPHPQNFLPCWATPIKD